MTKTRLTEVERTYILRVREPDRAKANEAALVWTPQLGDGEWTLEAVRPLTHRNADGTENLLGWCYEFTKSDFAEVSDGQ